MIKITRFDMIDKLLDDDIDTIVYQQEISYLSNLLTSGFIGYENYSDKELKKEYGARFGYEDEYIKIIKQ